MIIITDYWKYIFPTYWNTIWTAHQMRFRLSCVVQIELEFLKSFDFQRWHTSLKVVISSLILWLSIYSQYTSICAINQNICITITYWLPTGMLESNKTYCYLIAFVLTFMITPVSTLVFQQKQRQFFIKDIYPDI